MVSAKLKEIIDDLYPQMVAMAKEIYTNPELGLAEYKASSWLSDRLGVEGFDVQKGLGSLPTAFKAVKSSNPEGVNIAYLAEYDALPNVGHGCGHHLVGTGAAFAAIALSRLLPRYKGSISVLGTPSEENKGGKIILLNEGFFKDIDVALMAHPSHTSEIGRSGRAITSLIIEFEGKLAHSADPSKGVNALKAVIQTFNSIDAMFQNFPYDVSTNGIILEGGDADNIIPGYASCRFSIRGRSKSDVQLSVSMIKKIISSVEQMTGAKAHMTEELVYAERYTNMIMENRYAFYMEQLGDHVETADPNGRYGSSDIGNVSLEMPTMHPYYGVSSHQFSPLPHTVEYGEMCNSERAYEGLKKGVFAMASLGADLLTDGEFYDSVQREFEQTVVSRRSQE